MTDKTKFIEALDGTAAKIKDAFRAGYEAGFEDGGGDHGDLGAFDLDDEWGWYREARAKEVEI